MNGKCFIDTNVFIYMFDTRFPDKSKKARSIVEHAVNDETGVISYQVVQEFLNAASKKFVKPMTMYECLYCLDTIFSPLCTVFPSIEFYKTALSLKEQVGCSVYDAFIIAAAVQEKCSILYSEDLQDGRVIAGVKIQNPFTD
jgi:predicted nucleic acid-binding protein